MKTETNVPSIDDGLNALEDLLQKVIQPIVENEFSEKINENQGFQDGTDALKKIRTIISTLEKMDKEICDLPDEDVLETKFCEHSVPNGLAECADDIHWIPDHDKENENDNAFSIPIIKIRDNLLHEMSRHILESVMINSEKMSKIIEKQITTIIQQESTQIKTEIVNKLQNIEILDIIRTESQTIRWE